MKLEFELAKFDKRCKYHMVIDTETTSKKKGSFSCPLPYDIGITICSKSGKIVYSQQFVVKEIFDDVELMKNAYYFEKRPQYLKAIEEGKALKLPFIAIRDKIIELIIRYSVEVVCAYNYPFDRRAICCLIKYLYPSIKWEYFPTKYDKQGEPLPPKKDYTSFIKKHFFYNEDVVELCIMSLACETVLQKASYADFCEDNDFLTEKGNYQTTAEIAYRFLTGIVQFDEEHTGQDDTIIEAFIMSECYKMNKKVKSGVVYNPWRLVQKKKEKTD